MHQNTPCGVELEEGGPSVAVPTPEWNSSRSRSTRSGPSQTEKQFPCALEKKRQDRRSCTPGKVDETNPKLEPCRGGRRDDDEERDSDHSPPSSAGSRDPAEHKWRAGK
ncbi:uncharacterized protein APUU_40925S [Aspergillus puulaauensis]|uniref:Uncharacterized protein n=1 Tax=Aspergillus puulaauensis TaxID=1220207 RepID=A0A7R7XMY0_9EURO|nr:uncharacterized protein APUU_40925S [Aspergillus puulaauensis]BCS24481.1 hypothetical protein APUU_40925S [Aspergillus puulaauensis]